MSSIEKMISDISAIRRYNKVDVVNMSNERHVVNRVADLVECSLDERISVTVALARKPTEPTMVLVDVAPALIDSGKNVAYQLDLRQHRELLKDVYEVITGNFYRAIREEITVKYQNVITNETITKIASILQGDSDE
jgi:hypothetical protein